MLYKQALLSKVSKVTHYEIVFCEDGFCLCFCVFIRLKFLPQNYIVHLEI